MENPAPLSGPRYHWVEAPLERLPLFARAGAVLPRYMEAPQHLKGPAPHRWLLDVYPGDAQHHLIIPETGFTLEIDYHCQGGNAELHISPAPVEITLRMLGSKVRVLDASDGVRISLTP